MKNLMRPMVMVLIVSIILLTACGTQPASTPRPIADDLQAIEAAAEDIIDFAPSGNWDKISADVTDIAAAWRSYQPQAGADGASQELQDAMTSALTELQAASEQKDAAATMQASNDVSAAVVEMFALYNPQVPADIGRLDVLERQVILDVARGDYPAADTSLAKAKSAWERVKDSALEHNGNDVADQFEASLAAQAAALASKDNTALIAEARNALELVDSLERLY
jgi:hypothetical protein